MERMKQITMLLMFLLFIGQAKAQNDTVYNFTLQQAQDFAINHFFVSKNAALDIDIAKKKIWETTAIGLPQVSGSFNYQHIPNPPTMNFGGGEIDLALENSSTYGGTVSQLVFSGEYIVGLQASKTYRLFAEENYDKVRIDLKEGIASSYFALIILRNNRKILVETYDNLLINLDQMKKMFEQGFIEDTDLDQLDLIVKRTNNSVLTVDRQLEYLEKLFKYQLGLTEKDKVELLQTMDELVVSHLIDNSDYVFNLEDNIDYKLLTTSENLTDLSLKRQKSTFLPTVSAFYQYSDKTKKADIDFSIKHIMGVSVNIPILSSGMRMAQVSQAKIELDKMGNMKEQQSEMLVYTAKQSLYDYNTAIEKYNNEKLNFELSERVFNKTTIRFKEGMVSALDLSTINNQFLQAQMSYSTAIQELLTKKVALDKAYNKLN